MFVYSQPRLLTSRKRVSLFILFLLLPLFFYAQSKSLTGLWVGTLSNDSSTIRKDQSFEIALTEYKGRVYGYSRSEFIVNDTLYYIVKRVKGKIEGDVCEVTDDEIMAYNFRGRLDKKIKVTSTFRRNSNDSTWHLDGKWKTNATKNYYAITGKVGLSEEKDLSASKLFPPLEELNLANDVAFYKERRETIPELRIVKPEKQVSEIDLATADVLKTNTNSLAVAPVNKQRAEADPDTYIVPDTDSLRKQDAQLPKLPTNNVSLASTDIKTKAPAKTQSAIPVSVIQPKAVQDNGNNTVNNNKPSFTRQPGETPKKQVAAAVTTTPPPVTVNNTPQKQTTTISNTPAPPTAPLVKAAETEKKETAKDLSGLAAGPQVTKPDITLKAAVVEGRKSEFSQEVLYKSDSLQIALYDNGVVDGDTVSVFMNGEVIMAKQGLKASAIKKTIYLTPGKDDEFTLVLFAENLGLYPPNTGLLVVRDGDDVYNLRFSADFQKNAGIVFKRKK